MNPVEVFMKTCLKYAVRHKRICIATGSVLILLLLLLTLLDSEEMSKQPLAFAFILATGLAIMGVGFLYERKARRNTRKLVAALGLDTEVLARQCAAGYRIPGRGHEIVVTARDLLLFNKNGLTFLPLSSVTNVSKFTYVVKGKLGFMVNVILHVPDESMRRLKSHLESVYGKNADLSAREFGE